MQFRHLLLLWPLFISFVKSSPIKVGATFCLMLLGSMTSGIGILFIIPLLNAVGIDLGPGSSTGTTDIGQRLGDVAGQLGVSLSLGTVLIIYLTLIISVGIFGYLNSVFTADLQQSYARLLRKELYSKLLYAQWQYLSHERMSDFVRLVTGQVQSIGFSVQQILSLISQLVLALVYLGLSMWLSPTLTLLAFSCAILLVVLLFPLNAHIHSSGQVGLSASRQIFGAIIEQLSSLKIIKSFTAERQYLERLIDTSRVLEKQQLRMARFTALTRFVNLCGAALIFTILFYAAIQVIDLPLANLLLMLFIFSRLMPQVAGLQSTVQRLIHSAPEYTDLLAKSAELQDHREPVADSRLRPAFASELELSSLSYTYAGKSEPVFSNLSYTIGRNQSIALVGPSGSGKSTLADIIAGLLPPGSGTLSSDGASIDSTNAHHWRTGVAYVTQDVFLFHASIRENLTWVSEQPLDDSRLWEVLNLAAAETFVRTLPEQLDTIIGDRGIKLSGGERQRLALARALLSNPQILILDEATSALDRDNELKIRDALVKLDGQLTIIVIAHDDTTIEHISRRINMSDYCT